MWGVGETCPHVTVCPQSEKGVKQTLQWLRPGLFLADPGCNTCPVSDALVIQCWENVLFFLEEKCCFYYSSLRVCFQVLHEISRASPSQPMQPMICSWPLWGEVIRRKFLFSCICFPTQPCCFINFTGVDMCFKSDLHCIRKSSHSTDLSKHCLLTYGNKIVPIARWPSETDWCLCAAATCTRRRGSSAPFLFAELREKEQQNRNAIVWERPFCIEMHIKAAFL